VQGIRTGVTAPAATPVASATPARPLASQIASRTVNEAKKQTSVYKATRTTSSAPSTPVPSTPAPSPTATPVAKPITTAPTAPADSGKKGKTPPIVAEVLGLLTQRAQGGADAHALANIMENARDTISKSWRWHPALYELGTFARKLRKIPKGQPPDSSLLNNLMQKIKEWSEKMVD
jgi:hypothetical protein